MEYERIQRPQRGGGLSPAKLRSMLIGVEKKRREAKQVDSCSSLTSQFSAVYDPGSDFPESCKDVDVVREHVDVECSTSTTGESEMCMDHKPKDQPLIGTRWRYHDEYEAEYGSGHDSVSVSSAFEFQKAERIAHRVPSVPFSKPAPSKWDDAQKWIASPTSNRPRTSDSQGLQGMRKTSNFSHGGRKPSTKVVVEVPDEKLVAFEEPDTKKMDSSVARKESAMHKLVNWESEPYPMADMYGKSAHVIEKSIHEPAICLSQHDSSLSTQSETALIPSPSIARSVSMRDMGTEMTPIASQEPSRTGTPVKVKSPIHSPNSSRPSTPKKALPSDKHRESAKYNIDMQRKEISDKKKQMKTRKEIMELGTQLGKTNITAWACKDGEERSASTSMKMVAGEQVSKNIVETRAEAWEEAEKAKYMSRFEREEMKIQAWENHQKAKTEAEMRKIEVEVERMRAKGEDKLMNRLAAVRHKAEEKRAAAEAKMTKEAAKTEQQAEYIRKTGRIPSKFSCWSCCS